MLCARNHLNWCMVSPVWTCTVSRILSTCCSILLTSGNCNSNGQNNCEKGKSGLFHRRKKSMNEKSMETTSVSQKQAGQEFSRRLRGFALFSVLGALMLTLLLEALDQTVVGTALPRIIGSLQGFDRYTWAVTAYTLASTTMIPIVGKLSDQFGRKWFLVVGTALFLLGSVLAGASQSMDQLIAFRALQGLGAGIGIALILTVVGDIFPPAERARWQSIFGIVYGFSNLVGPTVG